MLTFEQVNPCCVELSQLTFNITVDQWDQAKILTQLTTLYNIISSDNDLVPANLVDYILVPVAKLLVQFDQLNVTITVKLLSILNHFASTTWYDRFNLNLSVNLFPFINHLSQSILNIDNPTHSQILLIVETFHNYTQSIINQPYHNDFFNNRDNKFILLSNLTNLVSSQLTILNFHSNNDIYIESTIISSLNRFYSHCLNFDQGEILSNILPGNVSHLVKFLCKPKINYKLIMESLTLFEFLIVTVYNDKSLSLLSTSFSPSSSPQTHRTEKWLFATREQVKLAINQSFPILIKRHNPQINKQICHFIRELLLRCFKSLIPICEDPLIKYLVQCQFDSFDKLISTNTDLRTTIYKGEYNYLNDLLNTLSSSVNLNQLDNIRSINFILTQNHNQVITYHTIDKIMKQLFKSLTSINKPSSLVTGKDNNTTNPNLKVISQSKNILLKDLSVSNSILNSAHTDKERINNKIWSKDMEAEISKLLNTMGQFINFDSMTIESNITKLNQVNDLSTQNSILWMILNVLPNELTSLKDSQHGDVIDMFLNLDNDNHAEDNSSLTLQNNIEDSCMILLEYGTNLLQTQESINNFTVLTYEQERLICIVLQIIQRSCQLMKKNFANELVDYLYLVVGNMASTSEIIRSYAQSCLSTISTMLYQGSIHSLLIENIDYLVESISQRLNMGMTQHVTSVLMIICKMTGYKVILQFSDILETLFQILDYYHGYHDLCLQIFQFFEIVVNEMNLKYMNKEAHLSLDSNTINSNSFKPWSCTNELQLSSLLKSKLPTVTDELTLNQNDLPFKPNEPKDFKEYFDAKLKIQEIDEDGDSDDENEDKNEREEEPRESDTIEWVSPIPRESYKLLIQIGQYGDRLLMHNSKPLRIQILKVIRLTVPMLATQYDSLLPQVAQIWDSVTQCLFDKDYSIINSAASTTEVVIHSAHDFISRRFIDLWARLQTECPLLQEVIAHHTPKTCSFAKSQLQLARKIEYPSMTKNTLINMSNMLLEGLRLTGFILNENVLKDMITVCLLVIPQKIIANESLLLGDVMYCILH